ncbi:GxxExxY protein [Phenylobacterium sp.]|uniref:GxxExxY protein n=1 Tax=Phenylobacterium sp. TaxID=1871053 RepID=UPI00301B73F5
MAVAERLGTTENTENTKWAGDGSYFVPFSGMDDLDSAQFLFKDEAFRIRGAVFQVYRTMGAGFLEAVYQECLAIELAKREIPFEASKVLALSYDGVLLRQTYVADFVCFGQIILELKALRAIAPEHRAQTINYLRAADMRLGLLVNFGATPRVEIERYAL